ncbi:OmpA family protein [Motiliproteus sediminis]|uniref:OmpA family protein n=1 Tax=Motiliproteus sediminis TaxID=1468178 RepID=UPI001AEFC664|nr:OmpA family protein [Motiliproteus sediminis]
MKTIIHRSGLVLALVTGLGGCASQPQLTHEQMLDQYPSVSRLDTAYQQVGIDDAELLAPQSYAKAGGLLKRATKAARTQDRTAATAAAAAGLQTIAVLERDSQLSRELLADVLSKRDRAYNAGANTLPSKQWAELDNDLKATTALVEQGRLEQVKRSRPKLLAGYSQLELLALKQSTIDQARSAISSAKQHGAEKYAPQTLAQAEEEMRLALSILDADRTQTDKAEMHASNARWQAQQSAAITETIKDFNRRDYDLEEVVLWHQQQLAMINTPLGTPLPFNQPSDKVVGGLRKAVGDLVSERDAVRNQVQKAEQQTVAQMAAYQTQMKTTAQQRQQISQLEQAERERFERVQAMFDDQEAKVYRQRKNILISVHGFDYPSGHSEIQAANFPLMNKLVRAVNTFPDATIEVSGHTDATGNDANNQALSQARAEKVSQFLMEVGGVDQAKMMARGFGETRPVASNDTREGRAENRRVEIVIVNQ